MAEDVEKKEESGWSFKGALTSTFKAVALSPALAPFTISAYKSYKSISGHVGANALKKADDPSKLVFGQLSQMEQFKDEKGQEALARIQNDKQFTAALNKAIKGDQTVADGLAGKATPGGNVLDLEKVAGLLADDTNRGVVTQVLDKVGESNTDELNFAYLTDVAAAGAEGNLKEVQTLLAKAGIQNDAVDMGADPSKLFGLALNDPQKFGQQMSKFMGLDGAQGQAFSQIFEFLGKFLQMVWGNSSDPNSIAHFVDKYAPSMTQKFNDLTGATDEKNKEALKADNDNPAIRADNDNPDIKVADGKRPTAGFNGAANDTGAGAEPKVAPAQPSWTEHYAQGMQTAARMGM